MKREVTGRCEGHASRLQRAHCGRKVSAGDYAGDGDGSLQGGH